MLDHYLPGNNAPNAIYEAFFSLSLRYHIDFIVANLTTELVKDMNSSINSLIELPPCIERLVRKGFIVNIEYSKRFVRITCDGHALRNIIPFGQTKLNEFG